jgi:phosphoglycolate phosphatase
MTEEEINSFEFFIFDLDGTLINSCKQIELAMNIARTQLGYSKSPVGQIFEKLGLPVEELIFDLKLRLDEREALISSFRQELITLIKIENDCFPYAVSFLTKLKLKGKMIAVATSKPGFLAQQVVINSELRDLIDHVQGTDNFLPKPNPEVILRCLNMYPKLKSVMIGDRVEDMLAAQEAKISSIGIAQTAHKPQQLLDAGAIAAFENFQPLLAKL